MEILAHAESAIRSLPCREKSTGGKQSYAKIGFLYDGSGPPQEEESNEDEKSPRGSDESSSDDSEDEEIENLAENYGVEDFHRLVRSDKKARADARAAKNAADHTEPGQVSSGLSLLAFFKFSSERKMLNRQIGTA